MSRLVLDLQFLTGRLFTLILRALFINFPMDFFLVSWRLYLFQNISVSASFSVWRVDIGEAEDTEEEEEEEDVEEEVEEEVDNDEAVGGRDFALFWYFSLSISYLPYCPPDPGENDWIVLDWCLIFLTSLGMT